MTWRDLVSDLIKGAEINFGIFYGSGLGAVLLALVIVVYLLKAERGGRWFVDLAIALRPSLSKRSSSDAKSVEKERRTTSKK